MNKISVDTRKLDQAGEKLESLANQYDNIIENLFSDINRIVNNAWSGSSSVAYRNSILRDKKIFISYGEIIKKYGTTLRRQSELLENKINKWENK